MKLSGVGVGTIRSDARPADSTSACISAAVRSLPSGMPSMVRSMRPAMRAGERAGADGLTEEQRATLVELLGLWQEHLSDLAGQPLAAPTGPRRRPRRSRSR